MTDTLQAPAPVRPRRSAPPVRRRRPSSIFRHAALISVAVVMIYPVLWMVVSSLRPNDEIFTRPGLVGGPLTLDNYTSGWSGLGEPFGLFFWNSTLLTLGSVLGNLASCSLAAYAFARIEFRFKRALFAIMLVTVMIPIHVLIVPQYVAFSMAGLVNTLWPLVLPKMLAQDGFFVFLMVQFIRAIPRELDEAARLDGLGHPRIFTRIVLPLMMPALATTAIFTFLTAWNDFFGSLIYLTGQENYTVPLALRNFLDETGASNYGAMFAMSVLSLVPVFLAFLFGQRQLVRGMATTGLK